MRTDVRRRLGAALLIALALILFAPAPASAHASLVSIDPVPDWIYEEPPHEVSLTFNEPVSIGLGGIRVFDPDGERIDGESGLRDDDTSVVASIGASGRGTYTVAWSVVSADSHVLSSTFVFHVGEPTGSAVDVSGMDAAVAGTLAWIARWAIFAGTISLGGLALFRVAVGFPLSGSRARVVAILAAGVLLVGAILKLVVQLGMSAGLSLGGLLSLELGSVLATRVGMIDSIRVVIAVVALVCALLWRWRAAAAIAGLSSVGIMVTLAVLGHAWSTDQPIAAAAVDVVHQLAVTTWVGGLVALVTLGADESTPECLRRFSRVAVYALAAVVVTGTASAIWQTAADPSTLTTAYGVLLLVKIGLVGIMVALGWWQRRVLAATARRAGGLLTGVRAEVVVAAIVVAVTAVLAGTAPARSALGPQPFTAELNVEVGAIAVTVQPALIGNNVVTMSFTDRVGSPRSIDVAQLSVRQGDLPPRDVALTPLSPDRWAAIDVVLPAAGEWVFELTAVARGELSTTTLTVTVDERTGATP